LSTRELILAKMKKNSVDSYKDEPTKPTEPSFEGFDGSLSHESGEKKETDPTEPDPVSLGTMEPGRPVLIYRGHVLAWEADHPHVRLFAWATVNLFPGRPLAVDIKSTAMALELTPDQVREGLARLVREGDLVRTRERGRELFRLNVRYAEGGER